MKTLLFFILIAGFGYFGYCYVVDRDYDVTARQAIQEWFIGTADKVGE